MAPPASPPRPGAGNILTRKVGPAPLYVWVATAAAAYLGYRYLRGGSGAVQAAAGPAGVTPTSGNSAGATDSGSMGGGGASPIDAFSADLLGSLLDRYQVLTTDLTGALFDAQSAIVGLGADALSQSGQLEQALLDSYTAAPAAAPAATTSAAPAAVTALQPVQAQAEPPATTPDQEPPQEPTGQYLTAPAAPDYGPEAGYVPAGTVASNPTGPGSVIVAQTYAPAPGIVSPGGAVYRSGGGVVTVQTNKGVYGKKPLQ